MYGGNAYGTAPYAGGGSGSAAPVVVVIPVSARDRMRDALGLVTVEVPVVLTPATVALAYRVDKAFAYPTPDLVDGRPT